MRRGRSEGLVLSCEHGGNRIPREHAALFRGMARVLASHRGWDPGALAIARRFEARTGAPLVASETSRLLVDLNRSPRHPAVFSEPVRRLSATDRRAILARHHAPHRARVLDAVRAAIDAHGRAVHVAVHSFTPVLDGEVRDVDVGLLYDPSRSFERTFCARWREALHTRRPDLRVRRNAPYRGVADGLPTALRRALPVTRYVGVELEINQRLLRAAGPARDRLADDLLETLLWAVDRAFAGR